MQFAGKDSSPTVGLVVPRGGNRAETNPCRTLMTHRGYGFLAFARTPTFPGVKSHTHFREGFSVDIMSRFANVSALILI